MRHIVRIFLILIIVSMAWPRHHAATPAPRAATTHHAACAVNGVGIELCGERLRAYCDIIARDYVRTNHDGSQTLGVGMPADTASACRSAGWTPLNVPMG